MLFATYGAKSGWVPAGTFGTAGCVILYLTKDWLVPTAPPADSRHRDLKPACTFGTAGADWGELFATYGAKNTLME